MGIFLHTDFDVPSIDLKKIKNEMLHGRGGTLLSGFLRACFYK
jgi:hypothetical protein